MKDLTIGFIGLGLIGGSIARGIKRSRRDMRIMAYMRSRDKLEQAKRDGVVDVILDGIGEEISWCDLVFLCTPVEYNACLLYTSYSIKFSCKYVAMHHLHRVSSLHHPDCFRPGS